MNKLNQDVFIGQTEDVNWCGVDFDGDLNFGISINPRITWASERWRGFIQVGETVHNSGYDVLTSINK